MSDPTTNFNTLVRQMLWPAFKALGYKKSGNYFRYYNPAGWGKIVQFQKSQWNSAAELQFTVNTGLYLPEVQRYWCSQEAGAAFTEPDCVVRQRLSQLKDSKQDEWYLLTEAINPTSLFAQLTTDFQQVVHPYLATITSRDDIYALLAAGYHSYMPSAQIRAMHEAGYQEAARVLFNSEWVRSASNQYYRTTLLELATQLELPSR